MLPCLTSVSTRRFPVLTLTIKRILQHLPCTRPATVLQRKNKFEFGVKLLVTRLASRSTLKINHAASNGVEDRPLDDPNTAVVCTMRHIFIMWVTFCNHD
ncbi:hypothetical protein QQP08_020431 [Theobroma cacao]|nr:hypothetical protein QQP08_020431 [Theobroma cacao]